MAVIPNRLFAGAMGWPFIPTFVSWGSDQQWAPPMNPMHIPILKKFLK